MNYNELMVGDLIKYKLDYPAKLKANTIHKVYGIKQKHVLVEISKDEIHEEYITHIEPIPLTTEILEKNGVTLLEVGDNGIATPKSQRNRYEKWFIHTKFVDTYLWYDRLSSRWHLHNMSGAKFKHVHELQHALRLCGLKDLADNFKL